MVDQNVVLRKIVLLEEYLQDLEETRTNTSWEQFSTDKIIRRYVERTLQIAVEACLDITTHLISYESFREPQNNKDCFQVLMEQGILPVELTEQLKKMAQFRNIIVHDYVRIQPEIVYAILTKNIGDIRTYAKIIKNKYIVI
jgi:uncharacterized protein YutE (UPF0331/DUF86 family)